ncbi:MAG: sugar phosphate isomerase/epimerase family protein [Bacteroidia bacterium]
MNRRYFIKNSALAGMAIGALGYSACQEESSSKTQAASGEESLASPFFTMSLAQWSLNQSIREHGMDPMDFAKVASELGFEGLEYVNHLYEPIYSKASSELEGIKQLTSNLKLKAEEFNIPSLLIMIDNQGDLGSQNEPERLKGVENHHKWVDAAQAMGCHSIRVNLFGDGSPEAQQEAASDSLRRLGEYSRDLGINVLVENHGGLSSDPIWLTTIMQNVNMANVGLLPDFGNFCLRREDDARWSKPCIEEYPDKVEAVKMMMPFAKKAVSAKTYEFNAEGMQDKIDYVAMIKMIKETGYNSYIGVEYEGGGDEIAGIKATKELLMKAVAQL